MIGYFAPHWQVDVHLEETSRESIGINAQRKYIVVFRDLRLDSILALYCHLKLQPGLAGLHQKELINRKLRVPSLTASSGNSSHLAHLSITSSSLFWVFEDCRCCSLIFWHMPSVGQRWYSRLAHIRVILTPVPSVNYLVACVHRHNYRHLSVDHTKNMTYLHVLTRTLKRMLWSVLPSHWQCHGVAHGIFPQEEELYI